MHVGSINSVSFKSNQVNTTKRVSVDNPFLYTYNPDVKEKEISSVYIHTGIGLAAAAAVVGTVLRLRKRNLVPIDIVEIADKNIGLNKVSFKNTAEFLKEKFLYPIIATIKGDEKFVNSDLLKSGLILTSKSEANAKATMNALVEHGRELGIYCMEMPPNLKRNGRIKWVYKALAEAKKYNKASNNDFVLINIGDIEKLADLKVAKQTNTRIEETLRSINSQTHPGIIWTGWTSKPESVPYFYNNAPVLITKIVD